MIYKHDIQYITQFYTPGSEARQLAPQAEPRKNRPAVPKYVKRKQVKLYVDPVALCSVVVAVAILVLMFSAVWQFANVCAAHEAMQSRLMELRDENALLEHSYRSGYDLDEVEAQARALGMVPVSEVQHIRVTVSLPEPEPEPTLLENITWFLKGLFE